MKAPVLRFLQAAVALGALLALLWPGSLPAAEPDDGLIKGPMRVGFTQSCFVNINRNDAEAGFKAFLQTVGRKRGYRIMPITRVYDDLRQFEAAMKDGTIQIAIMDSWQFLTMDIPKQMKPFFVPVERTAVGRKYLLLTRRGSGLNTLADLRGKGLTKMEVASIGVGDHWLDTHLLANGLGTQRSFFGSVETVAKPTAAVLPVFFGKKHMCFVDQNSFDIMAELNPQVGRDLQVVVASETCLNIVICLGDTGWNGPRGKEDTIAGLNELHIEPAGQQILTLFKITKLAPFQETHLDSIRKLRATYERLRKEAKP